MEFIRAFFYLNQKRTSNAISILYIKKNSEKYFFNYFRSDFAKNRFSNGVIIEGQIYPNHGRVAHRLFSVNKPQINGKGAKLLINYCPVYRRQEKYLKFFSKYLPKPQFSTG